MGQFEGGLTSAINSQTDRLGREATAAHVMQLVEQQRLAAQQEQQALAQNQQYQLDASTVLPRLRQLLAAPSGPPPDMLSAMQQPQPPAPGQASVPMMQPPPQSAPAPQFGPNPLLSALAQQLMPPPGANAPGGTPSPTEAPMPQAAAPQPVGWQGMPPGSGGITPASENIEQAGGDIPPVGMPPEPPPIPPKLLSIPILIEEMEKAGIPRERMMGTLRQLEPMVRRDNDMALRLFEANFKADKAGEEARRRTFEAETKRMNYASQDERRKASARHADEVLAAQQGRARQAIAGTTIAGERPAPRFNFSADADPALVAMAKADSVNPRPWTKDSMPEEDANREDTLRVQAWNYINTKNLPYRKGTGGGADRNDAVMKMVGTIGRELGVDAQELASKSAQWKADAQTYAFQTKKLDAIEGQLNSFHNNMQTWDSIAQGLPPAIGGERLAALGKDLQKINFSDSKTFNDVKLKIQSEFNDPSVAAYMVSAMAVAMDYARIMQGPQSIASLSEGARHDAMRLVATGLNDKARAATMGALDSDAQGQVKGIKDQLTTISGRLGLRGRGGGNPAGTTGNPAGAAAPTNAKGWKLMTDKNGAKAYVSPDGKSFEEVK